MYEHERLRVEQNLASARRALYRALEAAETAQEFGLEEDLRSLTEETGRVMADVMKSGGRA